MDECVINEFSCRSDNKVQTNFVHSFYPSTILFEPINWPYNLNSDTYQNSNDEDPSPVTREN